VRETDKLIEYDSTNLIERIRNCDKFITPVVVKNNLVDIGQEDSDVLDA